MPRKSPRGRGGVINSRKNSLPPSTSWSSDESGSVDNNAQRRQRGRRSKKEGGQTRRSCSSSTSLMSNDSGSSIDTQVDDHNRRGQQKRVRNTAARTLTHSEGIRVLRSLQRKLLSDNGARLSRIERRLLRADRARKGVVSICAFEAALCAEIKSDRGADIKPDEVTWLAQNLRGRNGRNIAISKMRALLETEETAGRRWSGSSSKEGQKERYHHHRYQSISQRRRSSRGGERRRRSGGSISGDRAGSEGGTTSESGGSRSRGAALQWRSSPPPPARWAIRQGTVGQWLHEVAAPMERKLFFEFIKGLEKFEIRNGLDHYRVRPSRRARRHHGFDNDNDGTTVLHLGPMLKASISFYV